jgi:hypothetical protein
VAFMQCLLIGISEGHRLCSSGGTLNICKTEAVLVFKISNINESYCYEEFGHGYALSKLCNIKHKHNSDYLLPKVCTCL